MSKFVKHMKSWFSIKKEFRDQMTGCIDVDNRNRAITVLNGVIREGYTHAISLGSEDMWRGSVKIGTLDKVAYLHLINDIVVVDFSEFSNTGSEEEFYNGYEQDDEVVYSLKELIEILKGEYTGLAVVEYGEDFLEVAEYYPL